MTTEEFRLAKEKIIATLGKPEYDVGVAVNEAARQLMTLRMKHMLEVRQSKAKSLKELEASIPEEKKKEYKKQPLPEIEILDKDLKGFSDVDAEILKAHFIDLDLEPRALANRFNKSRQYVAALLRGKAVQALETKYFYEILKAETMKSLLRAVKAGDSRITEGAAEFLKVMSNNEGSTEGSKQIEDPQALQALKELGDSLANKE